MRTVPIAVAALFLSTFGCGGGSDGAPDARTSLPADAAWPDADLPDAGPPTEFGGARPVTLQVPSSYSADTPTPLVIALHGFNGDPNYITPLLTITDWYEEEGFLFIAPDGFEDTDGNYYWNATDACCDSYDSEPDDVTYLAGLITEISGTYNVDPKRVYVIGHSNGGFMAYRLACDHADKIAAIISWAGATYATPGDCTPSEPVSVAQLHGTADQTILYEGGVIAKADTSEIAYPGAVTTVATWASYNGCDAGTTAGTPVDFTVAAGAETTVSAHTGCPSGVDTVLWTNAGTHIAAFDPGARAQWWAWFEAHPKP